MLADRRHPLRFTLWVLVAIWLTAVCAAGATYLILKASESGEGHYHGYDYNQQARCTQAPTRSALLDISHFTPVPHGDTALVTHTESQRAPSLIYVWRSDSRCVTEWKLDDGP